MKYDIKVGYNKYRFDTMEEACSFALTAKTHTLEKEREDRRVVIEFITEEESEDEE